MKYHHHPSCPTNPAEVSPSECRAHPVTHHACESQRGLRAGATCKLPRQYGAGDEDQGGGVMKNDINSGGRASGQSFRRGPSRGRERSTRPPEDTEEAWRRQRPSATRLNIFVSSLKLLCPHPWLFARRRSKEWEYAAPRNAGGLPVGMTVGCPGRWLPGRHTRGFGPLENADGWPMERTTVCF